MKLNVIQPVVSTGRGGSMIIEVKDPKLKDITSLCFNHSVWKRKWGDPVPDMPLDLQLELVNRCNLSCFSCPINQQTRERSTLSWDILEKMVDEAAEEGIFYFTICGIGEAGLHVDLFRLLRYIREKTVKPKGLRSLTMMPTVLISNLMWRKDQVKQCIENPPDLLSVSLAGLDDEEITKRRAPIDLALFYDNLSEIYQNRNVVRGVDGGVSPVIHVSTHIYPHEYENKKLLQEFKDKWFEIADAVIIKPTMIDQHHQQLQVYVDGKPATKSNLVYTNITTEKYERTAPCMEVSRRLSVDSHGDVWCGHHNSEDFGPLLGNVYHQSLRNIWHSDKMDAFRREVRAGIFKRPGCKNCGGEIRDFHKDAPLELEEHIVYG